MADSVSYGQRRWRQNKVSEYARSRAWIKSHPEKQAEYRRKYRIRILKEKKRWYEKHKEKIIAKNSKRTIERRKRDLSYRITDALRHRVYLTVKNGYKSKTTIELLGCRIDSFKIYLESLFEPGMTWENYGRYGWHIDHIMPCAIFDLTNPEHQKRCFHFSNLRPMWASDNMSRPKKPKLEVS